MFWGDRPLSLYYIYRTASVVPCLAVDVYNISVHDYHNINPLSFIHCTVPDECLYLLVY